MAHHYHESASERREREATLRARFAGVDDADLSSGADAAWAQAEVIGATIRHLERERARVARDAEAMLAELDRRERERGRA